MYQLLRHGGLRRLADGAIISPDPSHRDNQEAAAWIADGNTPQPAEPDPPVGARAESARAAIALAEADLAKGTPADVRSALGKLAAALKELV